jgi:hypothetical protein
VTPSARGARLADAAAAVLLLLLLAATLRPARQAALPDFDKAYYAAGRRIVSAPDTLYAAEVVDFVNLPVVALAFVPFARLEPAAARLAFNALGVASVLLAAAWFGRRAGLAAAARAGVLALLVLNGPLHYSFGLGNLTHVLLPLLLAAFLADRAGRHAAAGALAALSALVKIPLLVLALHFALRRRWRALGAFAATLACAGLVSLACFGFELHRTWFERCIRPFAGGPLAAFNVQSVDGFLARLMTQGSRHDWSPVSVGPGFQAARLALLALMAGSVIFVCWPRRRGRVPDSSLDLAIVLSLALLISPISWTHYYLFLLLPLWFLIGGWLEAPSSRVWRGVLAAGALLVSLPVLETPGRSGWPLHAVYRVTAHSPHLLGGVLLWGALLAARRTATRPLRR